MIVNIHTASKVRLSEHSDRRQVAEYLEAHTRELASIADKLRRGEQASWYINAIKAKANTLKELAEKLED